MRRFRYLDALTTAFVVILLVSNLVAQKIVCVGPFSTYLVVNSLKRVEGSDAFDAQTNFNPFNIVEN